MGNETIKGQVSPQEMRPLAWMPAQQAPTGVVVMTKVHDGYGVSNEQKLIRQNGLWWLADMSAYVYFTPTHYALITGTQP